MKHLAVLLVMTLVTATATRGRSGQKNEYIDSIRAKALVAGWHNIGFRVVCTPMPKTIPYEFEKPFFQRCVKQKSIATSLGVDMDKPYYKTT